MNIRTEYICVMFRISVLLLLISAVVAACTKRESFNPTKPENLTRGDMQPLLIEPYFIYSTKFLLHEHEQEQWILSEPKSNSHCDSSFYNRYVCGSAARITNFPSDETEAGVFYLAADYLEPTCVENKLYAEAIRYFENEHRSDSISQLIVIFKDFQLTKKGAVTGGITINWNGRKFKMEFPDQDISIEKGDLELYWNKANSTWLMEVKHKGVPIKSLPSSADISTDTRLYISMNSEVNKKSVIAANSGSMYFRGIELGVWK